MSFNNVKNNERFVIEWKDLSGKLHMKVLSESSVKVYANHLEEVGAKGVSIHRLRG